MVLLIQSGTLAKAQVAEAIRITFDRRGTHALPSMLPLPPTDWQKPYDALAKECGLSGALEWAFETLDRYLTELGIVEAKPGKS